MTRLDRAVSKGGEILADKIRPPSVPHNHHDDSHMILTPLLLRANMVA